MHITQTYPLQKTPKRRGRFSEHTRPTTHPTDTIQRIMHKLIQKSGKSGLPPRNGRHRFEHWYADNQVYFITARCRNRFPAFRADAAKEIFWDRLSHHTAQAEFTPWIVSLLPNHYHILGYAQLGSTLGKMMQRLHGSVAKLVNDLLPARQTPFWWDRHGQPYFDGCIRDETQCRRAYRYTQRQAVRHRLVQQGEPYPHTRIWVHLDAGLRRSHESRAFLESVPYKRYERRNKTIPNRNRT